MDSPIHPALPQFCSLVETDISLLPLVNTVLGHGSTQAAHSAAQHSFHDLHEAWGFNLTLYHTNLCTTSTFLVPEAASQGQSLQERMW